MGSAVSSLISAPAQIGAAFVERDAQNRAYKTQKKSLLVQEKKLKETYDPDRVNALVAKYDKEFLNRRLALLKEVDPEMYKLRQAGQKNLVEELGRDNETRQSKQVVNQLVAENLKPDQRAEALKDKLFAEANAELAAGATLPPEFQAELVRAGVSAGAGSGFAIDKRTIGGTTARAIGSAGVQLKQQRLQNAQQLAGTAQQLTDARARILQSIFPTVQTAEQVAAARGAAAFELGNQTIPSAGLTGREATSFDIQGREGARQLFAARKDLKAQKTLNDAANTNKMIGIAAQAATSGLDMLGGGGGGGGGGMMGGGGGGGGGGGLNLGSIIGLAGFLSDVDAKTDIVDINPDEILARVRSLPVYSWKYIGAAAPHVGPMAQDFFKAFGLGDTDRMISTVDAFGVLLAAVQGLARQVERLEERLNAN